MVLAILLALATLEVRGRIEPPAAAHVTLHAVSSPFTATTLAGPDGQFRFAKVEPGSYTLAIFIPRRREIRQTVVITRGVADQSGRVRIAIHANDDKLTRQPQHLVSARDLAVPERAQRLYRDAERRLGKNDIAGAISSLEQAVAVHPQFAAAWNHLGTIAYQTRKFVDAERHFRRALEADSGAYEPVVNLGGVLLTLGNLDEAWKLNVEAVVRMPGDALAQAQLGMTYLLLGKLELAEKHLLEARRLDAAHFSHPQLHLAEVYLRQNEKAKAAGMLDELLRHHPNWPAAEQMRARIAEWR